MTPRSFLNLSNYENCKMKHFYFLLLYFISLPLLRAQTGEPKPNIIFIVLDDLNDYVEGFGGHPQVETPNLLLLSQKGISFLNAFTASPLCAPSRTSFILGKDPDYTGIYENENFISGAFRDNFPPEKYLVTLPEWLKDSAGYFTYNIDKILHCDSCDVQYPDFDLYNPDPCSKALSWSKQTNSGKNVAVPVEDTDQGLESYKWGAIDSDKVTSMPDYKTADTVSAFFSQYAEDPAQFCDKPFFLAVGIRKPHSNLYVPEQYFPEEYIEDFYAEPFEIPYNTPKDLFPPNGIIMPPQPDTLWSDYTKLPYLSRLMVSPTIHNEFISWPTDFLSPLPAINEILSDSERVLILSESKRANAVMAYLAAIKFADEQIGRMITDLENYPEIYNNTIIIVTSDHGFSLGEKKAWGKAKLWETNIRIPLIITDLRNIEHMQCNAPVSLVDLFPTICDLAGVGYPTFDDGSNYLDGYSLMPYFNDPDTISSRVVVSQLTTKSLHCFPQNSVRNERWHYIQYHSNTEDGAIDCDSLLSYSTSELYEIGINRNIDPEEWKNLAEDANYIPVINYLQQFLPDSSLYGVKPHKVIITAQVPDCLQNVNSFIEMQATLYSDLGILINEAELENYNFIWTNNLTEEIFTGRNYSFDISSLNEADFISENKIIFYLTVENNASGKICAFEVQYIDIYPPFPEPTATFNIQLEKLTATITDHNIEGIYTSTAWNFGDGFTSTDLIPTPHTYLEPGEYTITNTIYFANNCNTVSQKSIFVSDEFDLQNDLLQFQIFPNPAQLNVNLVFSQPLENTIIKIGNIAGQNCYNYIVSGLNSNHVSIDISNFISGIYFIEVIIDGKVGVEVFEVM